MQTTIYSDGIANITILEGVVRFDLINITQIDKDKTTAKTVGAVAMSTSALLRTYNELSGVLNKLVEQGVVKRTDAQTAGTPTVQTGTGPNTQTIEPLRLS